MARRRHMRGDNRFRTPLRRMKSPQGRPAIGLLAGAVVLGAIAWAGFGRSSSEPPAEGPAHEIAVTLDSALVSRGAAIYATNCAACHGPRGEGEPDWRTSNADGSYPAPPHDASGHTWHHSDRLLLELIRDGGARYESGTFKSRMPSFKGRLSEEETRAVLEYLKSLWGPDERSQQAAATARDP